MTKQGRSGQLAREYAQRYPETSQRALAAMLYRDHPKVYASYNTARNAVLWVMGKRKGGMGHKTSRAEKADGRTRSLLRMPDSRAAAYEPHQLTGFTRALVLADMHVPYHDALAVEVAVKHGKRLRCDAVVLLGDTCDWHGLSHWEQDPEERDVKRELQANREMLVWLRAQFPGAQIVYKVGNHDERLERFLWRKAPEVVGCEEFRLSRLLRFADYGITEVPTHLYIQHEHLNLLHGHEYGRGGASSPVNPARGATLKSRECVMVAHSHRTSEHVDVTHRGVQIAGWSVGCLCDLRPRYRPVANQWNHGFAVLHAGVRSDEWSVENHRIIDGRVV